ncbi:S-adenosylmethionine synthetase N-terminal domain-containing protein, partial [Pseudomonas sp. GW460-13]|uniref:S-adenosylmethionine synthetase N-terminal domain-containing protein n=1 Tax=Pseudomonas sp. GW460-13 TaxID=2070590 RepID=UPI003221EB0C
MSDRILDAFLARDRHARVACETLLADQCVIVAGEFRTKDSADYSAVRESAEGLVREVLYETGYTN